MNKYYAGIGSRNCPKEIWDLMVKLGQYMANKGYVLRSGGAKAKPGEWSADEAFEVGCDMVKGKKEILLAKHATKEAIDMAMSIHPAPHNCNDYVKKLHGRNSQILLGVDLNVPVEIVVAYTKSGKITGGTGMGLQIAQSHNIKIYNLGIKEDLDLIKSWLYK